MKIRIVGSVLVLGLFLSACGSNPSQNLEAGTEAGIVHGKTVTDKNELKKSVVALISENDGNQALCTGTLVSKDTVLSAAHCVDGHPSKLLVVFASKVKGANAELVRKVSVYTQHPHWGSSSSQGRGDLALLHFEGQLPAGFVPVKLAPSSLELKPNDVVEFLGFGVTNGDRGSGSGVLRQTTTSVVKEISNTEIMTDGRKTSVCFGDSGGPAFIKRGNTYVQWGVASSVTNHSCNEASIHTSVMSYLSWISKTTKKLREKAN